MVKILTINNPFIDTEYFKAHGLNLDITNITSDKVFNLKFVYNITNSENQIVPLYTPDVSEYLEQFKGYSVIMFNWNPADYGDEARYTGGYSYHSPMRNGAFWCTTRMGDNQTPQHELMHCLGNIINIRLGDRTPKDFMDWTPVNGQLLPYYINDYKSQDPLSNYNITWKAYAPFIERLNKLDDFEPVMKPVLRQGSRGEAVKELQTLLGITADGIFGSITKRLLVAFQLSKGLVGDGICGAKSWKALLETKKKTSVVITRTKDNGVQTIGELSAYNGKMFTCKTLELPWKDNQNNISCIPKGTYDVKYEKWNSKDKYGYKVQNVPNRDGIFIHEGNYHFNYEGCIGLGKDFYDLNKDGQIDITSTVATVKAFETFMDKKDFTLTIQ